MKQMKQPSMGKRRQRGISLIQILLAAVVGTALTVAGIRAAQGQKNDAEFAAGVQMITAEVPSALASFFEINGRTYGAATPAADIQAALLARGVNPNMPWGGEAWTSEDAAGDGLSVQINFPCDGALRGQGCDELAAAINRYVDENATFNTATRGITNAGAVNGPVAVTDPGTVDAAVSLVYGRQG